MKPMTILVSLLLLLLTFTVTAIAQTCRSDIAASTPTSRFVDNANGTVTDSATGLVWKRCSEGQSWDGTTCTGSPTTSTWQSALQTGSDAVFAGMSDWRLPNSKELSSLAERQCVDPAINLTVFPASPSSGFWSSSPYGDFFANGTMCIFFFDGSTALGDKLSNRAVRLVRGGE